jgi:hypothetical protein
MLTGIRSDGARIRKDLEMSTFEGRYQLNAPGPGVHVGFIEDPHIRLQRWGCNLYHDRVAIENDLSNRTSHSTSGYRPMSRHMNPAQNVPTVSSRSTLPAFVFRDKEVLRQPLSMIAAHSNDGPQSTSSRLLPKTKNRPASISFPVYEH